jgi:hypothetical protein
MGHDRVMRAGTAVSIFIRFHHCAIEVNGVADFWRLINDIGEVSDDLELDPMEQGRLLITTTSMLLWMV